MQNRLRAILSLKKNQIMHYDYLFKLFVFGEINMMLIYSDSTFFELNWIKKEMFKFGISVLTFLGMSNYRSCTEIVLI